MHLTARFFSQLFFLFSNHFFSLSFSYYCSWYFRFPFTVLFFNFCILYHIIRLFLIGFFLLFHFSLFLSYSFSIYFSSFTFYLHVFCSQSSCSSASYCLSLGKCEMRDFVLSQLYKFCPHSSGTRHRVTLWLVSDISRQLCASVYKVRKFQEQ